MRRLGEQAGVDPATLTQEQVRAHVLRLKTVHEYSPSSMRTAVAALSAFFNLHLGNGWALFGLIRSPDRQTLPVVLTRTEVAGLLAVVREERFRTLLPHERRLNQNRPSDNTDPGRPAELCARE